MNIEESIVVNNNQLSTTHEASIQDFTDDETFNNRYEYIKKLGEGGYSKVFLLLDRSESKKQVMKINKFLNQGNEDYRSMGLPKDLLREIAVMQELSHDYIVKAHTIYYFPQEPGTSVPSSTSPNIFLISDYYENTLSDFIFRNMCESESHLRRIMRRLLACVAHLHR